MTKEEKEELKQELKNQNNGSFDFTAKEVCNILRISRATLSRLQSSASIEFNKAKGKNGSVRFTADAIASYIESQTIVSYGEVS